MQTVDTGRDMATRRFPDFTRVQRRQNIDVQLNLDGIVCIPGANVPPCSTHDSFSGKALIRSHYPMVRPFHNVNVFHWHFMSKTYKKSCIVSHTNVMGRQLT